MPWQEESLMSLRKEFVTLALNQSLSFSELCRRFGISRKTGYKWLARYRIDPGEDFADRSRQPHHNPTRTHPAIEAEVVALRRRHPAWGGRKLHRVLRNDGYTAVPAPSTITHILRRHGLLQTGADRPQQPYRRFEHAAPNHLWQMDFKGHFQTLGGRCDPLTVIDDHSRFNIVLEALGRTTTAAVQASLTRAFRRYGLPQRINMDNGAPWGAPAARGHGISALSVWLIRLGVGISFSAPAHPQTNGKDERFHRTLKAEVLGQRCFSDRGHVQRCFDAWRSVYNHRRPHEGIGMRTPGERYHPSPRCFPEVLLPYEYAPDDEVVMVKRNGQVTDWRCQLKVSSALWGHHIAFRPRNDDGVYDLYFCHHRLGDVDLKQNNGS